MVNTIIVGLGEVGSAVKKALEKKHEVVGIDKDTPMPNSKCEYLNICIPYSDKFVDIVNEYVNLFCPKLTIIHSTVPVGTTKKIIGETVHSPIRGNHPNLYRAIKVYIKFIGYNSEKAHNLASEYLSEVFDTQMIHDSDTTEFMKITSLVKYLVYLSVTDEINDVCKKLNINYDWIKEWEKSQNEEIDGFYTDMRWPVLTPPEGKIGGHCCLPVSKIFLEDCDAIGYNPKVVSQAYSKY